MGLGIGVGIPLEIGPKNDGSGIGPNPDDYVLDQEGNFILDQEGNPIPRNPPL